MSGTRYLREWSAAVRRAATTTPDLSAWQGRKQLLILGIRRTLRKSGVNGDRVDLDTLSGAQLERVRVLIATAFRRKQRGQALPPASPQNRATTPQNT